MQASELTTSRCLSRESFPKAQVEVGPELRLDDLASIRAFANTYRKQQRTLHVLVNNAGANYMSEGLTAEGVPLLTQVCEQLSCRYLHCLPEAYQHFKPQVLETRFCRTHRDSWILLLKGAELLGGHLSAQIARMTVLSNPADLSLASVTSYHACIVVELARLCSCMRICRSIMWGLTY